MAVYTEVNDRELKSFIAAYGLGDLVSFKGIAEGVSNTNYFVATTTGNYILTLYEKRVSRDDLPFFMGLLEHLAEGGIACPTPLRTGQGERVTNLAGRPAAIVTFLEGFCIDRPLDHHCFAVGETLARLHLAGQSYDRKRQNTLGLTGWRPLYNQFSQDADTIVPGLSKFISDELNWLEASWPKTLPSGIIHADLFPDNVFFRDNSLSGLIDFYFACHDAFALDVAICINAWCFDQNHIFNKDLGTALLRGYQSGRALSSSEIAALPTLCRGGAMRFLLTRSFDWLNTDPNALVKPHDPRDFLKRLQFHQTTTHADSYGLESTA